jgi:hypothetical protein
MRFWKIWVNAWPVGELAGERCAYLPLQKYRYVNKFLINNQRKLFCLLAVISSCNYENNNFELKLRIPT